MDNIAVNLDDSVIHNELKASSNAFRPVRVFSIDEDNFFDVKSEKESELISF